MHTPILIFFGRGRTGRLTGWGCNILSVAMVAAAYLVFGHVRLMALTVCLWLCLFYGLYRLEPAEIRSVPERVMNTLCGFGLIFQILSFCGVAFALSGWALIGPQLVFLAALGGWLGLLLRRMHRARRRHRPDAEMPVTLMAEEDIRHAAE